MNCPSCLMPLAMDRPNCDSCGALVGAPVQGALAIAPRLVTPGGVQPPPPQEAPKQELPVADSSRSARNDEAWRQEVLNRVKRHREARRERELPLFNPSGSVTPSSLGVPPTPPAGPGSAMDFQDPLASLTESHAVFPASDAEVAYQDDSRFAPPQAFASDTASVLDVPPAHQPVLEVASADVSDAMDLPMRPLEPALETSPRASDAIHETENARVVALLPVSDPLTVAQAPPLRRSLVGDAPLVDVAQPLPIENPGTASLPRISTGAIFRPASLFDRFQAGMIDAGVWLGIVATASYFASRVARVPMLSLESAWPWLALFGAVVGVSYAAFFTGLVGATPGKMACGIEVKRLDGRSLGPVAATLRALLGVLGVAACGIGVIPAFGDSAARTLHDRALQSRVQLR